MQISIFDYIEAGDGWQQTVSEYINNPENRFIPEEFIYSLNLAEETAETLTHLTGNQLERLCLYWGVPRSGAKAKKIERLLECAKVYEARDLEKLTVPKLRELYTAIGKGTGASMNKATLIEKIRLWQETAHEPFGYMVAEARHYHAVIAAIRLSKPVPKEVLLSVPAYYVFYRKANGLPTSPTEMTADEWVGFTEAVTKAQRFNAARQREAHWNAVEIAIATNSRLSGKVLDDHVRQTELRAAEIDRVTPKNGWIPAIDPRPGETVYLTDGIKVEVTGPGMAINTAYNSPEALGDRKLWRKTAFRIGDKVRWQGRVGRISHCCPSESSVHGEDYNILPGGTYPDSTCYKYFCAPVWEVEMVEPNPWTTIQTQFKNMDYVSWTDLDGQEWVGHIRKVNNADSHMQPLWVYDPSSGEVNGPETYILDGFYPPMKLTSKTFPVTEQAIRCYESFKPEYDKNQNRGAWMYLKRLHDLFGIGERPE